MTQIDWPTLINWIIGGAISFCFGVAGALVGALVNDRLQRRRDAEYAARKQLWEIRKMLTDGVREWSNRRLEFMVDQLDKLSEYTERAIAHNAHPSDDVVRFLGFAVGTLFALLSLTALHFWK